MAYDASTLPDVSGLTVGILGGTGDQGRGLAYRFARAGQTVLIGSRAAERGRRGRRRDRRAARRAGAGSVTGAATTRCARRSDVVIVAVPWDGHAATVAALRRAARRQDRRRLRQPARLRQAGPVRAAGRRGQRRRSRPPRCCPTPGSAPRSTTSARRCWPTRRSTGSTWTCWCSARTGTRSSIVQALAGRIAGMRGIFAGRLRNAHQVEALTANLIAINKRYKAHAGIRVTDL